MLLDDFQPDYDFTEVHSIQVRASAETTYTCIKELTPAEISPVMRLLIWLRALPERLVGRQGMPFGREEPMLSQMAASGFTILAEHPPTEIVFGILVPSTIGRFWQKSSALRLRPTNVRDFSTFNKPEYIRVVANLLVKDTDRPDYVSVRTESRCRALSPQALMDFAPYWRLIRPFSGLIRIVWLRGIKRRAERQTILSASERSGSGLD
jgi:hypothetical protein